MEYNLTKENLDELKFTVGLINTIYTISVKDEDIIISWISQLKNANNNTSRYSIQEILDNFKRDNWTLTKESENKINIVAKFKMMN